MNTKNNNENLVNNSNQYQEKNVNELTNQNFQFTIEGINFSYFDLFESINETNINKWKEFQWKVENGEFELNLTQDDEFLLGGIEDSDSELLDEISCDIQDFTRGSLLYDYFGEFKDEYSERIIEEIKQESPEYIKDYVIEKIESSFSNESDEIQKQKLVGKVDQILIQSIPDYLYDELKWIRKEYGDDEISDFLCEEYYLSKSPLINGIELLIK